VQLLLVETVLAMFMKYSSKLGRIGLFEGRSLVVLAISSLIKTVLFI
jgi:hypothetical protein